MGIEYIVLSMIIGAFIGGMTNVIAIRMLFRPYNPINIGKWKLPFTPGVIPSRHRQMAKQLGQLVEEHLLTKDTIRGALSSFVFQEEVEHWIREQLKRIIRSEQTLKELLQDIPSSQDTIHQAVKQKLQSYIEQWEGYTVEELIFRLNLSFYLDEKKEQLYEAINRTLVDILLSEKGAKLIHDAVSGMVQQQGPLASMVSSIIPLDRVADRIRDSLLEWIHQPKTKKRINLFVEGWLDEVGKRQLNEWVTKKEKDQLCETVFCELQKGWESWLERPIHSWLIPWEETILTYGIQVYRKRIPVIQEHVLTFVQKSNISHIVEKQVLSFPLQRVESIIQHLAKKELSRVTLFGAVLGGMIGFIQSIVLLMFLS